jgi:hypothetical protein
MGATLLGELPALPLHEAGMALRLSRIERDLGELLELSARAPEHQASGDEDLSARESTLAYPIEGHT